MSKRRLSWPVIILMIIIPMTLSCTVFIPNIIRNWPW